MELVGLGERIWDVLTVETVVMTGVGVEVIAVKVKEVSVLEGGELLSAQFELTEVVTVFTTEDEVVVTSVSLTVVLVSMETEDFVFFSSSMLVILLFLVSRVSASTSLAF